MRTDAAAIPGTLMVIGCGFGSKLEGPRLSAGPLRPRRCRDRLRVAALAASEHQPEEEQRGTDHYGYEKGDSRKRKRLGGGNLPNRRPLDRLACRLTLRRLGRSGVLAGRRGLVNSEADLVLHNNLLYGGVRRVRAGRGVADPAKGGDRSDNQRRDCAGERETRPWPRARSLVSSCYDSTDEVFVGHRPCRAQSPFELSLALPISESPHLSRSPSVGGLYPLCIPRRGLETLRANCAFAFSRGGVPWTFGGGTPTASLLESRVWHGLKTAGTLIRSPRRSRGHDRVRPLSTKTIEDLLTRERDEG